MAITHRIPIHANNDGRGLQRALDYITNDEKTDNGILTHGLNCNVPFALAEFEANARKYHNQLDDRVAYHIVQSFDISDPISPEQANAIGLELCKELYGNYQCVVATHIDKGNLHNHIIINATNLKGKKLEDRLANKKEGLYGLRAANDHIAKKYGCSIIDNPPPIGRYKAKNYDKKSYDKESQLYHTSWKSIIIEQIEELKTTSNSLDELLHGLALEGYQIKRGKYISIRPYGKERYTRLETISKKGEYSEEALIQFFKDKRAGTFVEKLRVYKVKDTNNKYIQNLNKIATKSKEAIELSSKEEQLKMINHSYPIYSNSRYKEKKRYEALCKSMDLLNDEGILSYDDLLKRIDNLKNEINEKENQYALQREVANEFMSNEKVGLAYMKTYNDYQRYLEQVEKMGASQIVQSEAVIEHLKAKELLNHAELQEVREFLTSVGKQKREANKQYAYINYLKSKVTDLERLKGKSLELQGYIKGMSFSNQMIDEERSDEKYYCVKLPYTNQYVYLQKDCVAWNVYEKRAYMYLVDDKEYQLYDKNDVKQNKVSGEELEAISQDRKKELDEYYRSIR